jgi:hypothetical protein
MSKEPVDSSGKPIRIGDRVRCRGEQYTIVGFRPGLGRFGTSCIDFDRPFHAAPEDPDEIAVDRIDL